MIIIFDNSLNNAKSLEQWIRLSSTPLFFFIFSQLVNSCLVYQVMEERHIFYLWEKIINSNLWCSKHLLYIFLRYEWGEKKWYILLYMVDDCAIFFYFERKQENDRLIYTVGITFFIYCKIFARTLREKKSMPATLKHWAVLL